MHIILDRDGVINRDSDDYIKSLEEWQPLPGSIEAMVALSRAGHRLAVATNQSGLGRGLFQQADLDAMHQRLLQRVGEGGGRIDAIVHCPHHPDEGCDCRKPRPGLLDQLARQLDWPLADSLMVGDSRRDLEAGLARGCRPVLVTTGKGRRTLAELERTPLPEPARLAIYPDLAAVAEAVLKGALTP